MLSVPEQKSLRNMRKLFLFSDAVYPAVKLNLFPGRKNSCAGVNLT